jgi:hypothetical protein
MLTHLAVHRIRTERKPDKYWADLFRVTRTAVRHARTGVTWRNHQTPSDTRARLRRVAAPRADHDTISQALASWRRPSVSEHP